MHCSFYVLHFMWPTCRVNFAEDASTTYEVAQAWSGQNSNIFLLILTLFIPCI